VFQPHHKKLKPTEKTNLIPLMAEPRPVFFSPFVFFPPPLFFFFPPLPVVIAVALSDLVPGRDWSPPNEGAEISNFSSMARLGTLVARCSFGQRPAPFPAFFSPRSFVPGVFCFFRSKTAKQEKPARWKSRNLSLVISRTCRSSPVRPALRRFSYSCFFLSGGPPGGTPGPIFPLDRPLFLLVFSTFSRTATSCEWGACAQAGRAPPLRYQGKVDHGQENTAPDYRLQKR